MKANVILPIGWKNSDFANIFAEDIVEKVSLDRYHVKFIWEVDENKFENLKKRFGASKVKIGG